MTIRGQAYGIELSPTPLIRHGWRVAAVVCGRTRTIQIDPAVPESSRWETALRAASEATVTLPNRLPYRGEIA